MTITAVRCCACVRDGATAQSQWYTHVAEVVAARARAQKEEAQLILSSNRTPTRCSDRALTDSALPLAFLQRVQQLTSSNNRGCR